MKPPIRILIVEDEVITAMALAMEFTRAGYLVCNRVVTGEEAITSASQDHPDVILMDIRLAGEIDGIEAAQQIHSRSDIPIIFMTAYPNQEISARMQHLKPLGYLIKPVRLQHLKPVLEKVYVMGS